MQPPLAETAAQHTAGSGRHKYGRWPCTYATRECLQHGPPLHRRPQCEHADLEKLRRPAPVLHEIVSSGLDARQLDPLRAALQVDDVRLLAHGQDRRPPCIPAAFRPASVGSQRRRSNNKNNNNNNNNNNKMQQGLEAAECLALALRAGSAAAQDVNNSSNNNTQQQRRQQHKQQRQERRRQQQQ